MQFNKKLNLEHILKYVYILMFVLYLLLIFNLNLDIFFTTLCIIFTIPLLSKISSENVFENETRRKIYDTTELKSAISLNDLRRILKMPRATLEWHLFILERAGFVSTIKLLNRRYVYRNSNEEKAISHLLRNSKKLKPIIKSLAFAGKIHVPENLLLMNISFESIRDLMVKLSKMNLIHYEIRKNGLICVTDKGKVWFKKIIDDIG
ncbi:MAG: hypothetical protein DRO23_03720 [Thermoprotei archaeon]|nr:MAG: hypothetical protein DRO23_03720 [Thermoprotei archaeon]